MCYFLAEIQILQKSQKLLQDQQMPIPPGPSEKPDRYKQTTQNSGFPDSPSYTACQGGRRKPTSLSPLLLLHIPGSCNSECPRTFLVASQQDVFRLVWEACHLCNYCHPDTDTVALWDHMSAASLESLTVISVIFCSRRASLYLVQLCTFWVNTRRQPAHATTGGSGKTNVTCKLLIKYFFLQYTLSLNPSTMKFTLSSRLWFDLNYCVKLPIFHCAYIQTRRKVIYF